MFFQQRTHWIFLSLTLVTIAVVIQSISNCSGHTIRHARTVHPNGYGYREALHFQRLRRIKRNTELAANVNPQTHKCMNPNKRYYKKDGGCYTPGRKGPCGENMLFYSYQDNQTGDCDCSHIQDIPLVYHVNNSQCYQIYQQGHCPSNHWLVYDQSNEVICEERKCPGSEKKLVFYKEKCVELFANDKTCENRLERVRFPQDEKHPRCADDNAVYNIGAPTLACSPGYSRDVLGQCRQKIKFTSNGGDFYFLDLL